MPALLIKPVFLAGIPFLSEALSTIEKVIIGVPTRSLLQNAFSDDVLKTLANFLKMSNDSYTTVFQAVDSLFNFIKPIGFAFIMTFFLIYLMGIISRDALTLESFIKSLISLVVVFALANASDKIISTTLNIGDVAVNASIKVIEKNSPTGSLSAAEKGADKNSAMSKEQKSVFKKSANNLVEHHHAGAIVIALIIWVVAKISQIGMYIAVLSRVIELMWRTILMPIGIANCFEGGGNSPGIRYLKTYLAVALSGALVVMIVYIGQRLALGILIADKGTPSIAVMFLACAALISSAGAAMSASAKVKEAFQ